eukprot:CAMPEP_0201505166 /NCGR_PEP_ID=MMETSP0151_2-20130828/85616_1 /ASSEMBLY_ACC=CAM_ASM_000257 /TAXON_ID=200890 /ORGANISM="Paramoeba atlantica, Strain 621/1 / CCAP 1560/9" /LENGTH=98 /DNA_ID=CAMNT_0047898993 /DNA_START=213 /DNA_END=509 /DNA_ORIENTATION=-
MKELEAQLSDANSHIEKLKEEIERLKRAQSHQNGNGELAEGKERKEKREEKRWGKSGVVLSFFLNQFTQRRKENAEQIVICLQVLMQDLSYEENKIWS